MSKETIKEIKISNQLLSWVLGCECWIHDHKGVYKNHISFSDHNYDKSIQLNRKKYVETGLVEQILEDQGNYSDYFGECKINLHTFINIAKIKAFECEYNVIEFGKQVCVRRHGEYLKDFNISSNGSDTYLIADVIEALEWVCDKVGGANK